MAVRAFRSYSLSCCLLPVPFEAEHASGAAMRSPLPLHRGTECMSRYRIIMPVVATLSATLWAYACGDPGDTLRLVAEGADANEHPVEGLRVGWSSSLASAATVDSGGLVRGVGEGVTTITATADTLKASTELTVINRDRAALTALYHATGGPNWRRNENWLSPRMQDWEGVDTELRDDGVVMVRNLLLDRNNLMGPIPPELGDLASLGAAASGHEVWGDP